MTEMVGMLMPTVTSLQSQKRIRGMHSGRRYKLCACLLINTGHGRPPVPIEVESKSDQGIRVWAVVLYKSVFSGPKPHTKDNNSFPELP